MNRCYVIVLLCVFILSACCKDSAIGSSRVQYSSNNNQNNEDSQNNHFVNNNNFDDGSDETKYFGPCRIESRPTEGSNRTDVQFTDIYYNLNGQVIRKDFSYPVEPSHFYATFEEYEYDTKGNQTSFLSDTFRNNVSELFRERNFFDAMNRLSYRFSDVGDDGSKSSETFYQYEVGLTIRYTERNADDGFEEVQYSYLNESGLVLRTEVDTSDDGIIDLAFDFQYDNRGNEIQTKSFDENGVLRSVSQKEYDSSDNLLDIQRDTDADGEYEFGIRFIYDNGFLVKTEDYSPNGEYEGILFFSETERDDVGRILFVRTGNNGFADRIAEYIYDGDCVLDVPAQEFVAFVPEIPDHNNGDIITPFTLHWVGDLERSYDANGNFIRESEIRFFENEELGGYFINVEPRITCYDNSSQAIYADSLVLPFTWQREIIYTPDIPQDVYEESDFCLVNIYWSCVQKGGCGAFGVGSGFHRGNNEIIWTIREVGKMYYGDGIEAELYFPRIEDHIVDWFIPVP